MLSISQRFVFFCLLFLTSQKLLAQSFESPVDYMSAINNAKADMNKKYLAYLSASAHGKRLKKVDKLRQQALESITQSRYNVIGLPLYKGDNSLRQSAITHIQFCYKIFNEDYANIVNMEEIAEQSFDEMQAYLLLQEKTKAKLKEANEVYEKAYSSFAAKYNVTLVDTKTEMGEKMEKASLLNQYHDKVFLIFFKCNWQDQKLVEALNNKKVNDIEQSRNALIQFANEGIQSLQQIKPFDGDVSLIAACKQALLFYKKTAETDIPKLTDFFLKEENFEKIKKAFEAKSASDRTKEDVDTYNKGVKDINLAVNNYNQTNTTVNNARNTAIQNWNNTEKTFIDTHMPYFK